MIVAMLMLMAAVQVDCDSPIDQSTMTRCAGEAFATADAALNRQWTQTLAVTRAQDAAWEADDPRPGYADTLIAAQRAWIAFRDAQCVLESYQMRGGSAAPMILYGCKARMTRERTALLKDLSEGN